MECSLKVPLFFVIIVLISIIVLSAELGKNKPFIVCSDSKQNVELEVEDNLLVQENYDNIIKLAVRKYQYRHGIAGMIPD